MNRSVITLNGLEILNKSLADGDTTQYWIGYYGLAFIPEESRGELTKNIRSLIPAGTEGDEIYNIFQGSMADTVAGFDEGDVDAGNLYKQCLYAENIESTFRYSLGKDEDGNTVNTLVTYEQDASDPSKYSHFLTYYGVCGNPPSGEKIVPPSPNGLPIPAPLYYAPTSQENETAIVTPDMRNYLGKEGTPGWQQSDESTRAGDVYADSDDAVSISTFNRYHAPSSSEGYAVAHEPACRNMATVTKYFPIDHYDVATIIRDGGLIQNMEAGKSSTNLSNAKVGTVKYKVCINIADYMKKAAHRVNMVDKDSQETTADNLSATIGFKFNRIGLYAVPVTLHAFNVVSADNEKCGGNKVQIEIQGDEEPVLFAVIDTDTIEMREDGLTKFEIDFSVVFQENTSLVDNPVIYYNLYENDAITWYKNQLIANASTSEAVTTLGVELNYLRNMIEGMNNSNAECAIGDDGDIWAYKNHTHPYMRNIVDSLNLDHGAVRGVYTAPEHENYTVYLTGGKFIPDDAAPEIVETLEKLEFNGYTVGTNSMVLGKDSLCAGNYSVNMSNYGALGDASISTLLMGGSGKNADRKYSDDHLAAKDAEYSFINVPGGEFQSIRGSLWTGFDSPVWVNGSVNNSIGVGRNDLLKYAGTGEYQQVIGEPTTGSLSKSALLGRNIVYTQVESTIVAGETERGGQQYIGLYDVFSDIDSYWMDWKHARSVQHIDDMIFPTTVGRVLSTVSVGSHNSINRGAYNILSIGHYDDVPTDSVNSILVGNYMNKAEAPYKPKMVLTLDEFNERYGSGVAYPSDDPVYDCDQLSDIVVVGSGTMKYQNGQGSTEVLERSVKGVSLYVHYSGYQWYFGKSVGEESADCFGNNPYLYADLYNKAGHLKNMLMLGDYMDAGNGSHNSILMGDYTGSRKLTFKNSFMNFMGDDVAYTHNATTGPSLEMDNVWWIGTPNTYNATGSHGDGSISNSNTTGHLVAATYQSGNVGHDGHRGVYKDAFVFRGDNPTVYAHAYWYGVTGDWTAFADVENTEGFKFDWNKLWQPVQSPMIYTGGLALGGYGTNDCNFMLLKIGTSATIMNDYMPSGSGINQTQNIANSYEYGIANFGEIRRSSNPHGPWDTVSKIYLERNVVGTVAAGDTTITLNIPDAEEIDETKEITISAYDSQYHDVPAQIDSRNDHTVVCSLTAAQSVDITVSVGYTSYKSDGKVLYNLHNECIIDGKDYTTDHFMVDSPYSGMVLMVQDKQELDGTLHVGLGNPVVSSYGNKKFVAIATHYVSSANSIGFHVSGDVTSSDFGFANTVWDDSKELNTTYSAEPITLAPGIRAGMNYHYEEKQSGSSTTYTVHVEKMFLEVSMDYGYDVCIDCKFSEGNNVYVDPDTNEHTIICVDGNDNYGVPTYIWTTSQDDSSDYKKTFSKLWHATIGMIEHTGSDYGGHLQSGCKRVESIAPNRVYKLMTVKWSLDAHYGYGNPWKTSYASTFEDVTDKEGISLLNT